MFERTHHRCTSRSGSHGQPDRALVPLRRAESRRAAKAVRQVRRVLSVPFVWLIRRWRRKTLLSAMIDAHLTVDSRIELLYLIHYEDDRDSTPAMAALVDDPRLDPALRIELIAVLWSAGERSITPALHELAADARIDPEIRFDAAVHLLDESVTDAEPYLRSLVHSAMVSDEVRLEAAMILSEHAAPDIPDENAAPHLAYLASGAGVPPRTRIEAARRLAYFSRSRYEHALWAIATDPEFGIPDRLGMINCLAEVAPDRAADCCRAMALDGQLPVRARLQALDMLESLDQDASLVTITDLLDDPLLDDAARFDLVRKLTLLE